MQRGWSNVRSFFFCPSRTGCRIQFTGGVAVPPQFFLEAHAVRIPIAVDLLTHPHPREHGVAFQSGWAATRGIRRAKERDLQVASACAGRNTSRKISTRRFHAKLKRRERRAPGLTAYGDGQAYVVQISIAVNFPTCCLVDTSGFEWGTRQRCLTTIRAIGRQNYFYPVLLKSLVINQIQQTIWVCGTPSGLAGL